MDIPTAPEGQDAHRNCNYAWKQVRCDRCGRTYQCTPSDDYYCVAEGDHCCESCLLRGRSLIVLDPSDGEA